MTGARIAVIGGSGFYDMEGLADAGELIVDTPYGATSSPLVVGSIAGGRVAFLARHGTGHRILPSEVPSRANIWALKSLGVERIVSVSAVGSLQEDIAPLSVVVPGQIIDRTNGSRPGTFFGQGLVAHIAFDEPFCPATSDALASAAGDSGAQARRGGTYVVIEGPAFSTKAESRLYRSWGAQVIGMTALPEAKLAREAEICYATLALVTDYDTWHADHDPVSAELIIENLSRNVATARRIVADAIARLPGGRDCRCASALAASLVTPMELVPEATKQRLAPLIRRYVPVEAGA
jgi:5'-methylthioadenosine phosphorylase